MPKNLVDNDWCPMEVAEMVKWSFLIGSVLVAFNGVQTRVLVDAPGQSSRKLQQPSTVSHEHLFANAAQFVRSFLRNGTGFAAPEFVDSDFPRHGISPR